MTAAVPTARYAAFISYSSGATGKLAAALQSWLERFATPWYKPRRLRIFRDYTSLSAGADLAANLTTSLAQSEWLILLASPEAAASAWVDKEVRWWREHRSGSNVIVVLARGNLAWNDAAGDWTGDTDAVPPSARGMFSGEPLWVDLRSAVVTGRLDRTNPDLLGNVARIAAPLLGVDKDTIVGEHLTLLRRARRQRGGAVAALAVLLVTALAAGTVAVIQARRAGEQARIAESRALASASATKLESHLDLAQLLAVEAYRMNPDVQSRAALFNAVTSSPAFDGSLMADASVTRVAATLDGAVIVAGTTAGTVSVWHNRSDRVVIGRLRGGVSSVAVSAEGQ